MKRAIRALLLLTGFSAASAQALENPILGYTHLLPSPYTLPAGRVAFGTDVAVGITDFLQVGTCLLCDIEQIYNANVKVALIDVPGFSFAITGGIESYNLQNLDPGNPNLQITSYQPGAVAGVEIVKELGLLVGGNFNFSTPSFSASGVLTTAYARGGTIESDLSWAALSEKRFRPILVLSGGVSYDFTYQLVGVGLGFHLKGFHLGAHYYPNATSGKVLPILAGGAAIDF